MQGASQPEFLSSILSPIMDVLRYVVTLISYNGVQQLPCKRLRMFRASQLLELGGGEVQCSAKALSMPRSSAQIFHMTSTAEHPMQENIFARHPKPLWKTNNAECGLLGDAECMPGWTLANKLGQAWLPFCTCR